MKNIKEIKSGKLRWVNINQTGEKEIDFLKKFNFHHLHLEDCKSITQRPKLNVGKEYLFMVLLFPKYNRKTREITSAEVDFLIKPGLLITIHRSELNPLMNLFNLCQVSPEKCKEIFNNDPIYLLYQILSGLFAYCSPILDTLSSNVSNIEKNIFKGYERRMVHEILIVKRSIVNFRRIMQIHRLLINKLLQKSHGFSSITRLKIYFEELIEANDDIWQNLENLKQTIEAIEETNNSLISFQLNDIIKILTTISVIVLPITLLASVFGMNISHMPLVKNRYGFWIIGTIMITAFILMISYFKKKKWL